MRKKYKPSYYTLIVEHGIWTLLFNGVTSGLMKLPKELADELIPYIGTLRPRRAGSGLHEWNPQSFTMQDLPPQLRPIFKELLRGHFFIPSDEDETSHLRGRYEYYRQNEPFLVTITTTMDCNLACYYCYEDKSKTYLTNEGCDKIIIWIKDQIEKRDHKQLYTDWYGGEPMLNQDAIEYFSKHIIDYCYSKKIQYSSSIISNGTHWPDDPREFVQRTCIRHAQFTLDGPRRHHDRRRRYNSETSHSISSFDRIVHTIDQLVGHIRIYLRINVDPWIGKDALSLVKFFGEKGWLDRGTRFYPYLAMIGPMTEHCGFLGTSQKVRSFQSEFDELNHEFQREIAKYIDPREIQHLQYYPMTMKINCAAVGQNSVIFGPDGLMYKCALEVGDPHKAHDKLPIFLGVSKPQRKSPFVILNESLSESPNRWQNYDPFNHPSCSQCQYLPICMGGCPKTHFDKNDFYLKQQCRYWEENFDTVIRTYFDAASKQSSVVNRTA